MLSCLAAGVIAAGANTAEAQQAGADSGATVADGVFSPAQATRGQRLFEGVCVACHEPAQFTASPFLDQYDGKSVDTLFRWLQENMPEDAPGQLRPAQYADVISYIFSLNGFPPGEEDLPTSRSRLREIRIEVAGGAGGG